MEKVNKEIKDDLEEIERLEKDRSGNERDKDNRKKKVEKLQRKLVSQKLLTYFRNTLTFTKNDETPLGDLNQWQEHLKTNPKEKGTPLINLDFFGNMYAIIMVPMFTDKKLIKARIDDIGYLNDTLFGKSRI